MFPDLTTVRNANNAITGLVTVNGGYTVAEVLHTHVVGEAGYKFSSGDVQYAETFKVNMSTRFRGTARLYDHNQFNTGGLKRRYNEHTGTSVCRNCL